MKLNNYFSPLFDSLPTSQLNGKFFDGLVTQNLLLEATSSSYSLDLHNDFMVPTDRLLRDEYIRKGPIRPDMKNISYTQTIVNGKRRSFKANWFTSRTWLEYNKYNNSATCFPCRIFGHQTLSIFDDTFVRNGFKQWSHALEKNRGFDKHSKSEHHKLCMEKWISYLHEVPIDVLINNEKRKELTIMKNEKNQRKEIVYLLIDVVNTLARLNLPFRGHYEGEEETNKGVFKEIIDLISRYYPPLRTHLEKARSNPFSYPGYLSCKSQNELIQTLRQNIIEEVRIANFFSICLDTTPDLSKKDQLSFVIRYVNEDGEIKESLLEMVEVLNCTAGGLVTKLVDILGKYGLLIDSIRGQSYDGCATMAGKYNGVQNKIKTKNPKAYFVHCYAHRLNLVIVDTCKRNVFARNFFGIMQKLYVFIEGSTKRHGLFQEFHIFRGKGHVKDTLKSLSDTRWSSRAEACEVMIDNITVLQKVLDFIIYDGKYDSATAADAFSLLKCLDFEFCLCLVIFTDLLKLCNIISKYLQSADLNIASASFQIESLICILQDYKTEECFEKLYLQVEKIAQSIGAAYIEPRKRKLPSRYDENNKEPCVLTGKDRLRYLFFYDVLDLTIEALQSRFSSDTLPLLKSIDCLNPPKVENLSKLKILASYYIGDLNEELLEFEYKLLRKSLELSKVQNIGVDKIYLHMVKERLNEIYPNMSILFRLILTLPVTSCSCERSFSSLKIIKNRLRSTMSEKRLNDLVLLSVEAKRMKSIPKSHEKIHEQFWSIPRK